MTELPSGKNLARVAIDDYIGKIYAAERQIKDLREEREKSGTVLLEPHAYLRYLFEELPKASTAEALEALLPWNVKPVLRTHGVTANCSCPTEFPTYHR